jgi:hypothetical protein
MAGPCEFGNELSISVKGEDFLDRPSLEEGFCSEELGITYVY